MNLTVILILSVINMTLVDYLVRPLRKLLTTEKQKLWLSVITPYVAAITGFAMTFIARVNVFAELLPDAPIDLQLILTALLSCGGAGMLYKVVKRISQGAADIGGVLPVPPLPPVIGDV